MMRFTHSYVGAELAQFEEAMRLIPALCKHRLAGNGEAVESLLSDYQIDGVHHNVSLTMSWSILAVAGMNWVNQLMTGAAESQDENVNDLLDRAIAAAANWIVTSEL